MKLYYRRPIKLAYSAEFHQVDQAIAFEKKVKGWTRAKKVAFIGNKWDLLHDLSRCTNKTGRHRALNEA